MLHNLSFFEDPTRIIRAARFEARYAFHMDAHTEALARHALADHVLDRVTPERLQGEINRLFREPNPLGGLRRIAELGILDWLSPGLRLQSERLERVEGALAWTARHSGEHLDRTVIYLAVLLADLEPASARAVAQERLRLSDQLGKSFLTLERQLAPAGSARPAAEPADPG